VSTHQVDDLSELFDWVVILQDGIIRFEGTVNAFLDLAPPGDSRPAETAYARVAADRVP
jgi:ABC-2 type transport system ATP-binding protein